MIEERLRAVGRRPVDGSVQSSHLALLARAGRRSGLHSKVRLAGVFLAGLLLGGSGLAAAGALPDQAQHLAHQTLDQVGIDVPDPERYHGPECGSEVKRNHGAYVRDDHDLATSRCGKPVQAGQDGAEDAEDGETEEPKESQAPKAPKAPKVEKGPCQGPPPWAGKDGAAMTPEEKAAAQAERAAECGEEDEASP